MAIFDTGAALTTLGALQGRGWAIRGGTYTVVEHVQPVNGNSIPLTSVGLSVLIEHDIGWLADVEFQVSRDPLFATVDWTTTVGQKPDGQVDTIANGLLDENRYYWRARVKESGPQGVWSDWSSPWVILVDTGSGRGFAYSDYNIATSISQSPNEVRYIEENVGWLPVMKSTAFIYDELNVAVIVTLKSSAYMYAELGDVSTNTPIPHLWWLSPPSGRPGEGIRIFCFGVGDLVETYDGVVEVNYGGDNWEQVQVLGWQTYPPDPNAYTELRELNPITEHIDMQHTVVEITVPDDAIPPGYPIRIRTNGP